ncbi:MAG: M23 family metallopeptidase [Tidjanibacter sp.]|nr:M23 family metallopeptidase [Tidjanibacter sp.]
MAKKEYIFNPSTLAYEPVRQPERLRRFVMVRRGVLFFIAAAVVNLVYSFGFYTPKMKALEKQRREILGRYEVLSERIGSMEGTIGEIAQRDNNVYRPLFGADTLSVEGIYTPFATDFYDHYSEDWQRVVGSVWQQLDGQTRLLYRQSLSLDQLQVLSKDKEKMAASIPAIWPINRKDLRGPIGAYGRRLHPIYKRYIHHKGIDFGGRRGDPIYATGNGVVSHTEKGLRRKGYGQQIVIDHGFGYKTRYAHLNERLVKKGQEVKRGELIGYMGNTGGSTGPHLHYEVIYMGRDVDPINYFRRDMSEAEFERIISSAKATTFETLDNNESSVKE